jgi:hypothetical protein
MCYQKATPILPLYAYSLWQFKVDGHAAQQCLHGLRQRLYVAKAHRHSMGKRKVNGDEN